MSYYFEEEPLLKTKTPKNFQEIPGDLYRVLPSLTKSPPTAATEKKMNKKKQTKNERFFFNIARKIFQRKKKYFYRVLPSFFFLIFVRPSPSANEAEFQKNPKMEFGQAIKKNSSINNNAKGFLPSFTGCYLVLPSFMGFLPSCTWFYRVVLGFTEFDRVLPSFTGFYWV